MNTHPYIFNRARVRSHRERAARHFSAHDFLYREIAERLGERLDDFAKPFPVALDLSAHEIMAEILASRGTQVMHDDAVFDSEQVSFAENTFDLVVSAGGLHWINDLPGMLIQIRKALRPGGLFVAILPGGETLKELRHSFEQTEMRISGGVSPRVSPFIDVRDGAALLQRAGFEMPVADSDMLTVEYNHPLKLLHDLRGMGETNALVEGRKHFTSRRLMMEAMEYYMKHFASDDGRAKASFELVTITGFKLR